jgi:predicted NBD/HSP70 family sugar kinase
MVTPVSDLSPPPGSQSSLREANRNRIIGAVKHHGGLTQVELAGATGLSPATVSNIVKELTASGVLHATPSTHSGRRAVRVTLAHGLGLVVGIHIDQRHMRVALADLAATIVAEHHLPLARDHRADAELDRAAMLVVDMLESVDSKLDEVLGIGIGVAAPIDARTGTIARRGIMRGWDGVRIAESLQGRLQRPVHVDNSSNLAAIAETRYGAARGKRDVLVIDVGEGIGAGLLVDGRLIRGHRGAAGEFGHLIVQMDGPRCRCGNRGCLEAVASAPAVIDALPAAPATTKTTDLIIRAMSGDPTYMRAVADAGRTIGRAAAGLCNVLDPERVVIGGELARAGELLLGPMRHAMEAALLLDPDGTPDLVQSQLDQQATVLGGIAVAIDAAPLPEPTTVVAIA